MYYTEADVKKAVKVLFFEGAGCAERGDLENCRIRTAFRNDEGKAFYLELSGIEPLKKMPERWKYFKSIGFVDYCYELGKDGEKLRTDIEDHIFEYSKQSILDFVNMELGCSFTDIVITDMFYGYRVHKDGGGYNFMEDHDWNVEKAHAARMAFFNIDMAIRKQLGEKYSKISLHEIGSDSITVRCYASEKSMRDHGMDPDNRFITVEI
jgi:hypothetical protein